MKALRILAVVLALAMIGYGVVLTTQSSDNVLSFEAMEYSTAEYVSDQVVTHIQTDLGNRSVLIRETNGSHVEVSYYTSDSDAIDFLYVAGVLTITDHQLSWIESLYRTFFAPFGVEEIVINIPQAQVNQLTIETSNGLIDIDGDHTYAAISLSSLNGDISVSDLTTALLDIECANGNIVLNDVSTDLEATLSSSNGNYIDKYSSHESLVVLLSNGSIDMSNVALVTTSVSTANGEIFISTSDFTTLNCSSLNGSIVVETGHSLDTTDYDEIYLSGSSIQFNNESPWYPANYWEGTGIRLVSLTTTNGEVLLTSLEGE